MTIEPRLIGRKDAASYCGLTPSGFSAWVASGKMPPPIPGTRKWDKKAIDEKLDAISGIVPVNKSQTDDDAWGKWEAKDREREKHRPLHRLDAREQRILRFMIAHPDHLTVELIPQAGEKTMETLAKVGVVRPGAKDSRGMREWSVTDEGRAEVKRIDTYRNWQF
ncbi:helix-turn-helix transcriptional regulator [Rhizobium ruizarguesonis]